MKKVVLKVHLCDDRSKSKAKKIIDTKFPGVDSMTMDMESKKMTVVGDDFDSVHLAVVLRKHWATVLVSVRDLRNQEDNNYDGEEDGDGGGSSGGRGGSGRRDGGDSDGGDNDDDRRDPFNQSGGRVRETARRTLDQTVMGESSDSHSEDTQGRGTIQIQRI